MIDMVQAVGRHAQLLAVVQVHNGPASVNGSNRGELAIGDAERSVGRAKLDAVASCEDSLLLAEHFDAEEPDRIVFDAPPVRRLHREHVCVGDYPGLVYNPLRAIFLLMMTLRQLMAKFPTNDDCKQYLMGRRWPDGIVHCPRCGSDGVYDSKTRPFTWQCRKCPGSKHPYRFSVLVGTIFENTNYPLKTWFEVLWQMLNSKKGVSALQIHRQIGSGSYETAWYMCMRLRAGMQNDEFKKLMGIV
jgi:transposase-like protein